MIQSYMERLEEFVREGEANPDEAWMSFIHETRAVFSSPLGSKVLAALLHACPPQMGAYANGDGTPEGALVIDGRKEVTAALWSLGSPSVSPEDYANRNHTTEKESSGEENGE